MKVIILYNVSSHNNSLKYFCKKKGGFRLPFTGFMQGSEQQQDLIDL